MTTSQNGYSAPIIPVSREIPGGRVSLRSGPAGDLLVWVAKQFHTLVEPLEWPGNWGYAYRDVRGSTDLSNHASGTALDLNAPKHPLGTEPSASFNPSQIATIRGIVAATRGAVRWGGDYTGRKDPMHFEINASEPLCAAVLISLAGQAGGSVPIPTQRTSEVSMQRITVTPPNAGENFVRLDLSGTDSAAVIVRPRLDGKGNAVKPMWVGNVFAWGSDHAGVGGNPRSNPNYDDKLTSQRRFPLPGAIWADLYYSASESFVIDVVG